jgi:hypothetical protein
MSIDTHLIGGKILSASDLDQMNATEIKNRKVPVKNTEGKLLTADKIEEIRLSALLSCAYQRLFFLYGEESRIQSEIEAISQKTDNVESNTLPEVGGFLEVTSRMLYLSILQVYTTKEISKLEMLIESETN